MTTAAAAFPAVKSHTHHPRYVAIFIWLFILTCIEVSIPEFVHMDGRGHDPMTPTVVSPTAFANNADPNIVKAAAEMAPTERYTASGWATRIGVLAFLAIIKAALVAAFFMHLRFDGWKLNLILAAPTTLFVVIIVLLSPDVAVQWPTVYPPPHIDTTSQILPPQ